MIKDLYSIFGLQPDLAKCSMIAHFDYKQKFLKNNTHECIMLSRSQVTIETCSSHPPKPQCCSRGIQLLILDSHHQASKYIGKMFVCLFVCRELETALGQQNMHFSRNIWIVFFSASQNMQNDIVLCRLQKGCKDMSTSQKPIQNCLVCCNNLQQIQSQILSFRDPSLILSILYHYARVYSMKFQN